MGGNELVVLVRSGGAFQPEGNRSLTHSYSSSSPRPAVRMPESSFGAGGAGPYPSRMHGRRSRIEPLVECTRTNAAGETWRQTRRQVTSNSPGKWWVLINTALAAPRRETELAREARETARRADGPRPTATQPAPTCPWSPWSSRAGRGPWQSCNSVLHQAAFEIHFWDQTYEVGR